MNGQGENMNKITRYYKVEHYSMKCRLYPTEKQKEKIDFIINSVHRYHNCLLYDMFHNGINLTEKKDQQTGEVVHFPDFNAAMKANYKNKLANELGINKGTPASALTSQTYGIVADIKAQMVSHSSTNNPPPIERMKPNFYSKRNPRRSYGCQETYSKIKRSKNKNVIHIDLAKVGLTKIRGWNRKLRFDSSCEMNFIDYAEIHKKDRFGVSISKDNCGDYWIVFKLSNVYKPVKEPMQKENIGVDVGIKDIAILSNGTKYENKKFKQKKKKDVRALNRRLSRRMGFSNIKFREARKEYRNLQPSKRYLNTKLAHAKLERKIARQRNHYNNVITTEIVANSNLIGIETLKVTNMFRNKHLAYALSDAAMGSILQMIKYKSEWYKRECKEINQWTPSSKECNVCGYRYKKLTLSVRKWTCPECGTMHDRDINAAKNILKYAVGYNLEKIVA